MADAPYRKKLIEVSLPLAAINAESAREKSIRHGHPSTLHLWWARRPLAACRAVLFASLVDDPDSDPQYRRADGTVDEEAAGIKRADVAIGGIKINCGIGRQTAGLIRRGQVWPERAVIIFLPDKPGGSCGTCHQCQAIDLLKACATGCENGAQDLRARCARNDMALASEIETKLML